MYSVHQKIFKKSQQQSNGFQNGWITCVKFKCLAFSQILHIWYSKSIMLFSFSLVDSFAPSQEWLPLKDYPSLLTELFPLTHYSVSFSLSVTIFILDFYYWFFFSAAENPAPALGWTLWVCPWQVGGACSGSEAWARWAASSSSRAFIWRWMMSRHMRRRKKTTDKLILSRPSSRA